MALFKKGHVFREPGAERGYILTRDVEAGDYVMPETLEPFGGAEEPKIGGRVPEWLG